MEHAVVAHRSRSADLRPLVTLGAQIDVSIQQPRPTVGLRSETELRVPSPVRLDPDQVARREGRERSLATVAGLEQTREIVAGRARKRADHAQGTHAVGREPVRLPLLEAPIGRLVSSGFSPGTAAGRYC